MASIYALQSNICNPVTFRKTAPKTKQPSKARPEAVFLKGAPSNCIDSSDSPFSPCGRSRDGFTPAPVFNRHCTEYSYLETVQMSILFRNYLLIRLISNSQIVSLTSQFESSRIPLHTDATTDVMAAKSSHTSHNNPRPRSATPLRMDQNLQLQTLIDGHVPGHIPAPASWLTARRQRSVIQARIPSRRAAIPGLPGFFHGHSLAPASTPYIVRIRISHITAHGPIGGLSLLCPA